MNSKRLKVGIIGCGTIGSEIARACRTKLKNKVELSGLCDVDTKKAAGLSRSLSGNVRVVKIEELIERSQIVVEAASASVSAKIAAYCVSAGKDCLIMSVGGLIGKESIFKRAEKRGVRILIPSGAISGIDGLKSAMAGRVDSVTLTTRKPPKGLAGAPYLKNNGIDVSAIDRETVIFDGTAAEAVKAFPQNVNVSAVLSLAGIGAKRTRVRIVTSPDYTANIHEIEITGESGSIKTRTENRPSKANPKTSALAAYSAIATLEEAVSSVRVGT